VRPSGVYTACTMRRRTILKAFVCLASAIGLTSCLGLQDDLNVSILLVQASAAGVELAAEANALLAEYSWTFGDGETSDEMSPEHVYEERGTYTINLNVFDVDGRHASAYVTVSVGHDWTVPDQGNLQTVIDGAEPGDTIFVIDNPKQNEVHTAVVRKDVDIRGPGATLSTIRYEDAEGSLTGFFVVAVADTSAMTLMNAGPTVTECSFLDNEGLYGAAIHAQNSTASFEDCEFDGNSVDFDGGAVYASDSALTFIDCLFANNEAEYGGGAVCAAGTHAWPSFTSCTFATNHAEDAGGAILLRALEGERPGEPALSRVFECSFISNRAEQNMGADTALVGGAIHVGSGCQVIQRDNTFTGNTPADVVYEDL